MPEEIPSDEAGLAEIRRKAFLKPYIANRLVSQDGRNTWVLLKLRPFPDDSVWYKGKGSVPPENLTGRELEHIIRKDKYKPLNPKGMGLPYLTDQKMKWIGKELPRIMGLAILLAIVVLIFATRSLRGVVVPVVTAIGSIVMSYGMLGYLRAPRVAVGTRVGGRPLDQPGHGLGHGAHERDKDPMTTSQRVK